MAEETKTMEKVAEETLERIREAIENYFEMVRKVMGMNPWSGTDLVGEAQRFSSDNIHATFEFLNRLVKAKDFQDVVQLQTEFMQAQMGSFADQFKALGESYSKAVGAGAATKKIPVKKG